MTGEQVLAAALALCCLFALGTSAATLDASVDTRPDDVIEFDQASIPLPSDEVGSLKEQLQSEPGEGDPRSDDGSSDSSDGEPRDEESADESSESSDPGEGSTGDGSEGDGSSDESGDRSASNSDGDERPGPTTEPDLLDRLLALLLALLDVLSSLLPVFLAVGAVAVAARHPRRLEALLASVLERFGPARDGDVGDAGTPLVPSPSNDVARTWYEMVRRLGLDDDPTATTGDVSAAAVRAGVDPEVIREVTEPFEEVQYGGAPVTETRRSRAREGIERFRAQYRDGGSR